MKPSALTCTQSYGRGGTVVPELHKPSKTWNQTNEKKHNEGVFPLLYMHPSMIITTCLMQVWNDSAVATGWIHQRTQPVAPWRHQCGCASSGRLRLCTPSQNTHVLESGSRQTSWPGTGGETSSRSQRCASRTLNCKRKEMEAGSGKELKLIHISDTTLMNVTNWIDNGDKTNLSTSSRAIMSPFFRALMAYMVPVFLYSDSNTCEQTCNNNMFSHKRVYGGIIATLIRQVTLPKCPLPSTAISLKSWSDSGPFRCLLQGQTYQKLHLFWMLNNRGKRNPIADFYCSTHQNAAGR